MTKAERHGIEGQDFVWRGIVRMPTPNVLVLSCGHRKRARLEPPKKVGDPQRCRDCAAEAKERAVAKMVERATPRTTTTTKAEVIEIEPGNWKVRSQSRRIWHTVKRIRGVWSCGCERWIYQRLRVEDRTACAHIDKVRRWLRRPGTVAA